MSHKNNTSTLDNLKFGEINVGWVQIIVNMFYQLYPRRVLLKSFLADRSVETIFSSLVPLSIEGSLEGT